MVWRLARIREGYHDKQVARKLKTPKSVRTNRLRHTLGARPSKEWRIWLMLSCAGIEVTMYNLCTESRALRPDERRSEALPLKPAIHSIDVHFDLWNSWERFKVANSDF